MVWELVASSSQLLDDLQAWERAWACPPCAEWWVIVLVVFLLMIFLDVLVSVVWILEFYLPTRQWLLGAAVCSVFCNAWCLCLIIWFVRAQEIFTIPDDIDLQRMYWSRSAYRFWNAPVIKWLFRMLWAIHPIEMFIHSCWCLALNCRRVLDICTVWDRHSTNLAFWSDFVERFMSWKKLGENTWDC
jgi:hypothetical protein